MNPAEQPVPKREPSAWKHVAIDYKYKQFRKVPLYEDRPFIDLTEGEIEDIEVRVFTAGGTYDDVYTALLRAQNEKNI